MKKVKKRLNVMFWNVRKGDDDTVLVSDPPSQGVPDAREHCDQEEGADPETASISEE